MSSLRSVTEAVRVLFPERDDALKSTTLSHLMIGIPAFDEAATIARVIAAVPTSLPGVGVIEIVVVDDGSRDATAALAAAAGATVLRHVQNGGVGAAFKTLVHHALETRADALVTLDGDGQFDPAHIPQLLVPIQNGTARVVTASRFLDPALVPQMPWVKKWGNRRVAALVSSLAGRRYADVSCGFRAYSRHALLHLTVYASFTYTHETFLDLAAKRIPFQEVPLPIRGVREHGKSKVASSVIRYGWRTSVILVRTYRDHRPLALCLWLAAPVSLAALVLFAWSFSVFLETGSWLKWAAFTSSALFAVAAATVFTGFLADIATRLRRNQEEILFWLRRRA